MRATLPNLHTPLNSRKIEKNRHEPPASPKRNESPRPQALTPPGPQAHFAKPAEPILHLDSAIGMAQEGGIGAIHRNLSVDQQALEVEKVKKWESGMILDPVTVDPEQRIADALEVMHRYHISGLPVTKDGQLVGILTNRDLRFEKRLDRKVGEVM